VISGFFSHSQFNQIPNPTSKIQIFKKLYAKMIQLYRSASLNESQKSKVWSCLNSMQEKSTFMGVSDMPTIRNIENESIVVAKNKLITDPNDLTSRENFTDFKRKKLIPANSAKQALLDKPTLNDTRVVNESFQDSVQLLENGFVTKMQEEMLVLVDVLHNPASLFPANSIFRLKAQHKNFIAK
jgi:hypothetical protein